MTILLFTLAALAATPPRTIEQRDLERFWKLAPELMAPDMPPLARNTGAILKRIGTVTVEFELTIDSSGVPGEYTLHRIDPPDTDPRPFMATELFMRYRAASGNPNHEAVRFRVTRKHFMPDVVPGLSREGEE